MYQVRVITVFTVFRLLTDFVCLYNYEFWLSLCKIVRSSVILVLPLFMVRVFPIRELKSGFIGGGNHRGSQLYFHITRYMLKEEGRALFLLPKVKVEFRHLSSLQKRFSLCSSHKIKSNIVVFCWLTGLQWNNTRF
jgi:hypothetical protein